MSFLARQDNGRGSCWRGPGRRSFGVSDDSQDFPLAYRSKIELMVASPYTEKINETEAALLRIH
ncbi:MAG: hypothetical protein AAGJ40_01340 [Planctomycetota bacterium]